MSIIGNLVMAVAKLPKFALAMAVCLTFCSVAPAQNNGGNNLLSFNRIVGGVEIDANGVLNEKRTKLSDDVLRQLKDGIEGVSADLEKAGLRMISLSGLNQVIQECIAEGKPLPADAKYLAGLQRIEYVIRAPEKNDIYLAGPGEAFEVDADGNVVGKKSRLPVIQLEDLLIAMRTVDNARSGYGISVSIDPSEQGISRLNKMLRKMNSFGQRSARKVEEIVGPQDISLTGIPTDSRYAQILVSADYKMKRLSMGLEKTPSYLPSMLEMAQKRDSQFRKMAPRFWMECSYNPIAVSENKNVWKLSGSGVKTLTDEQYFDKNGQKKASGKGNKMAQQWADTMTSKFDQLSKDEPVFRELRNLMDLSVVAAIIKSENMIETTNAEVSAFVGTQAVSTPAWQVPQQVPTQCSFVKLTKSWVITASGGVEVDSWGVIKKTTTDSKLDDMLVSAKRTGNNWWWNAN